LWSTGETASSIFVNPAATTNYTLVTYNAQGCPSGQAVHTLTVNPVPTASITGPTIACKNASVTLTAAGGTSYLWSTGETTQSITPTITNNITYTVTVTDNKGCTATTNHAVTVIPESVINISGDLDICAGETFNPNWSKRRMNEEHDRLSRMQQEIANRREAERNAEYAKLLKVDFRELHKGLEVVEFDSGVVAVPLVNMQQVQEEGSKMHHCVGSFDSMRRLTAQSYVLSNPY
jgi:hypothetical protein